MTEIENVYADRTASQIRAAYREKHRRHLLFMLPILAAILACLAFAAFPQYVIAFGPNVMTVAKIVIGTGILIYVVASMVDWRCPKCNNSFGKKLNPRFCDNCGVQLQD